MQVRSIWRFTAGSTGDEVQAVGVVSTGMDLLVLATGLDGGQARFGPVYLQSRPMRRRRCPLPFLGAMHLLP
jgi:hypothetical protein